MRLSMTESNLVSGLSSSWRVKPFSMRMFCIALSALVFLHLLLFYQLLQFIYFSESILRSSFPFRFQILLRWLEIQVANFHVWLLFCIWIAVERMKVEWIVFSMVISIISSSCFWPHHLHLSISGKLMI